MYSAPTAPEKMYSTNISLDKMNKLLIIILVLMAATSCGHNRQGSENNASDSADSSKIRTLEAFLNIDYAKAFEDSADGNSAFPDFSSNFISQDPESTTPMLLFVSEPDCSSCIAATLDFLITYSSIDTECPKPIVVLKDGSSDTFEFYKEKVSSQSSTVKAMLDSIPYLCGDWPSVNNAPDGAYLIYRNRVIAHLPWSPL